MDTPLRDLRATGLCALALLLAACATVAAQQSSSAGSGKGGPAATAAPSAAAAPGAPSTAAAQGAPTAVAARGAPTAAAAQGAPTAAAAPPVPKPTPLQDGSYRDLLGNKLVPPAAMIGGKIEPVHGAVSKHLGVDPSKASMLSQVIPGLPAAKAGLETHDIILAVEGLPDASEQTLRSHIRSLKPGDRIVVTYRRGNETGKAVIVLEPWHPDHMIRPLRPEHFTPMPALTPPGPATTADLHALEQRVAALEKEVAELRKKSK